MPIETRIQTAVAEAENRLHDDLHAAVTRLEKRVAALESQMSSAAVPAPAAPRRGRPARTAPAIVTVPDAAE